MTKELVESLTLELRDAEKKHDPDERREAVTVAQGHILVSLMDCQRKTADRVKELCAARETAKAKLSGAKLAWDALKILSAAGGGALVLKLLHAAGVAG